MTNKVKIYGKAQNRTALGIVNAYLVMFPEATLDELRQAFPNKLNHANKELFVPKKDLQEGGHFDSYFTHEDELLITGDNKKVAFFKLWPSESFNELVSHASMYGIEVDKFEAAEKGIGKKGGFSLEYLNGYEPPKKKSKWWWGIPALIVAVVIGFFVAKTLIKPVEIEKEITITDTVNVVRVDTVNIIKVDTVNIIKVDTVYRKQVRRIQKEFNAAQFQKGKADLNDDAKESLFKLASVLKRHKLLSLRIVGHASAEGTEKFNRTLSEARAKAAYDFLVSRGIPAERMQYEGRGATEPIDKENPMAEINRRTEFIVDDPNVPTP